MTLNNLVQLELDSLVALYKRLHANPELSCFEEKTSSLLADHLEACGIEVIRNIGGFGIAGILENGEGPTVMIRTDMDALPIVETSGAEYASTVKTVDGSGRSCGVMHGCGHDIHMTVFVGAAKIISQMKDAWKGRVLFVGQPAEESMSGAKDMLDDGLFEKCGVPNFCLAMHVFPTILSGSIAVRSGPIMAGTFQLKIIVRGVGGHGAFPQEARDPIVLAARIVTSLQTIVSREISPLNPAVVTVGSIHGGTRSNIIPEEVVMEVTTRFFDSDSRNRILDSIKRICKHEALAMDLPENLLPIIELNDSDEVPATINDKDLTGIVRSVVVEHLGERNLSEPNKVMGSEDFALFRKATLNGIPCCLFFAGATSPSDMDLFHSTGITVPGLHNSKFLPPPESTISTAVTTMVAATIKVLSSV
ncbi:M20 metallopeptidase family protein [Maridesulfovibrio frigidus]|uniref:M20 metallopeptidase family protein n=1 Tax=Maridesulfovibrio frigidus TaxID=340956 RepID=UPI00068D79F1|nr:amidohydrolase [Maridesulfovibrio frigidus]